MKQLRRVLRVQARTRRVHCNMSRLLVRGGQENNCGAHSHTRTGPSLESLSLKSSLTEIQAPYKRVGLELSNTEPAWMREANSQSSKKLHRPPPLLKTTEQETEE